MLLRLFFVMISEGDFRGGEANNDRGAKNNTGKAPCPSGVL